MGLLDFNSQKIQSSSTSKLQADDCINSPAVEICDGPDGCGYAKSSCICDYLKSKRGNSGDIGTSGGMRTTTYNLDN